MTCTPRLLEWLRDQNILDQDWMSRIKSRILQPTGGCKYHRVDLSPVKKKKPGGLGRFLLMAAFGSGVNRSTLKRVWFSSVCDTERLVMARFGPEQVQFLLLEIGFRPVL
jgi:hypothetical protein